MDAAAKLFVESWGNRLNYFRKMARKGSMALVYEHMIENIGKYWKTFENIRKYLKTVYNPSKTQDKLFKNYIETGENYKEIAYSVERLADRKVQK